MSRRLSASSRSLDGSGPSTGIEVIVRTTDGQVVRMTLPPRGVSAFEELNSRILAALGAVEGDGKRVVWVKLLKPIVGREKEGKAVPISLERLKELNPGDNLLVEVEKVEGGFNAEAALGKIGFSFDGSRDCWLRRDGKVVTFGELARAEQDPNGTEVLGVSLRQLIPLAHRRIRQLLFGCGLVERSLCLGGDGDGIGSGSGSLRPTLSCLVSPDVGSKEVVLLLVPPIGAAAGVWDARTCLGGGLARGSMLPYVLRGLAAGFGVVVADPASGKAGELGIADGRAGVKEAVEWEKGLGVAERWERYLGVLWRDMEKYAKRVAVCSYGSGGRAVLKSVANERKDRVVAMAVVESKHEITSLPPVLYSLLVERACVWHAAPVGKEVGLLGGGDSVGDSDAANVAQARYGCGVVILPVESGDEEESRMRKLAEVGGRLEAGVWEGFSPWRAEDGVFQLVFAALAAEGTTLDFRGVEVMERKWGEGVKALAMEAEKRVGGAAGRIRGGVSGVWEASLHRAVEQARESAPEGTRVALAVAAFVEAANGRDPGAVLRALAGGAIASDTVEERRKKRRARRHNNTTPTKEKRSKDHDASSETSESETASEPIDEDSSPSASPSKSHSKQSSPPPLASSKIPTEPVEESAEEEEKALAEEVEVCAGTPMPIDLRGRWYIDYDLSDSTDPLLTELGVPWLMRKMAERMDVRSTIEEDGPGKMHIKDVMPIGTVEYDLVLDGKVREMKGDDGKVIRRGARLEMRGWGDGKKLSPERRPKDLPAPPPGAPHCCWGSENSVPAMVVTTFLPDGRQSVDVRWQAEPQLQCLRTTVYDASGKTAKVSVVRIIRRDKDDATPQREATLVERQRQLASWIEHRRAHRRQHRWTEHHQTDEQEQEDDHHPATETSKDEDAASAKTPAENQYESLEGLLPVGETAEEEDAALRASLDVLDADVEPPVDLTGQWTEDYARSDRLDPLLAALGVPWLVRRMADSVTYTSQVEQGRGGRLVIRDTLPTGDVVQDLVMDGVVREKREDGKVLKRSARMEVEGWGEESFCGWGPLGSVPKVVISTYLEDGRVSEETRWLSSRNEQRLRTRLLSALGREEVVVERVLVRTKEANSEEMEHRRVNRKTWYEKLQTERRKERRENEGEVGGLVRFVRHSDRRPRLGVLRTSMLHADGGLLEVDVEPESLVSLRQHAGVIEASLCGVDCQVISVNLRAARVVLDVSNVAASAFIANRLRAQTPDRPWHPPQSVRNALGGPLPSWVSDGLELLLPAVAPSARDIHLHCIPPPLASPVVSAAHVAVQKDGLLLVDVFVAGVGQVVDALQVRLVGRRIFIGRLVREQEVQDRKKTAQIYNGRLRIECELQGEAGLAAKAIFGKDALDWRTAPSKAIQSHHVEIQWII